jgi:hypothetical protein
MGGRGAPLKHQNGMKNMSVLIAEEQRRQAMLSGDIAVLEALLSDGLVYVHSTGGAIPRPPIWTKWPAAV